MFWFVNLMRKENYKITNLTSIYTINTSKNKKITTLQTLQKTHGQKMLCYVYYVLDCQSNAERILQKYKPYKHLFNRHMKKQKN